MRRVIIESPYGGFTALNIRYMRACVADSLRRGEAPFASHAMYTQNGVLDDADPADRDLGIEAGLEWRSQAHVTAVYTDLGISPGMQRGINHALNDPCAEIEYRTLGGPWPLLRDIDPGMRLSIASWSSELHDAWCMTSKFATDYPWCD